MDDPEFHRLQHVELLTKLFDHVHQKEQIQTEFVAKYKEWYYGYKNIFADMKSLEGKFCIPSPDITVTKLAVNSVSMACFFVGIFFMDSFLLFLGFIIPAYIGTVSFYLQERAVEFVTKSTTTGKEMLSVMKLFTNRLQETKKTFIKFRGDSESENEPLELSQIELWFSDFKTESVTGHLKKYVSYQNIRNGSIGGVIVLLFLAILSYDFTDRLTLVVTAVIILTIASAAEMDSSMLWLIKFTTHKALIDNSCESLLKWFSESCGFRKIVETPEGFKLVKIINSILTRMKLKCENVHLLYFVSAFYLVELEEEFRIFDDTRPFFETVFRCYLQNVEVNFNSESSTDSRSLKQEFKNVEFSKKDDIKIRLREATPEDGRLCEKALEEISSEDCNLQVHQKEPILAGQRLKEEILEDVSSEDCNMQVPQQKPILGSQRLQDEILQEVSSADCNVLVQQKESNLQGEIVGQRTEGMQSVYQDYNMPMKLNKQSQKVSETKNLFLDNNTKGHLDSSLTQHQTLGKHSEKSEFPSEDFSHIHLAEEIPKKYPDEIHKVEFPSKDRIIEAHQNVLRKYQQNLIHEVNAESPFSDIKNNRGRNEQILDDQRFEGAEILSKDHTAKLNPNEIMVGDIKIVMNEQLPPNQSLGGDIKKEVFLFKQPSGTQCESTAKTTRKKRRKKRRLVKASSEDGKEQECKGEKQTLLEECRTEYNIERHKKAELQESYSTELQSQERSEEKLQEPRSAKPQSREHSKENLQESCSKEPQSREQQKETFRKSRSAELQSREQQKEMFRKSRSAEPQSREQQKEMFRKSRSAEPQSREQQKEMFQKSRSAESQSEDHSKAEFQKSVSTEHQREEHLKAKLQKSLSSEHLRTEFQKTCSTEHQGEKRLTADCYEISSRVDEKEILRLEEQEKSVVGNKERIPVKENQERLGDNNRMKINMHKICKSRIQNDEHLENSSEKFHCEKPNTPSQIVSEKRINLETENISTTVDGNGLCYESRSFQTRDSETFTNTVAKNGRKTPKPKVLTYYSIINQQEQIGAERNRGECEIKNFNTLSAVNLECESSLSEFKPNNEQLDPSYRSTCIRENIKTLAHIRRSLGNMSDKISLLILNIDNYEMM